MLDYNCFKIEFLNIVLKKRSTPVLTCSLGHKTYCFEGSVTAVYETYTKPCTKCGSEYKILIVDPLIELD